MSAKKRTPQKPPPPPAERKQSPGARHAETEKSPGRAALDGTTAREQAEKALRMSEARFRSIFEHAGTGIAINGLEGRFVQCNPAYCRITGYSEVELCAMKFSALIHPEDRAENLKIATRLLNDEIPSFGIENRYLRKNGEAVWVHKFISLLRDEQGRATHIVALVTDITERRRAGEELRRSEASLANAQRIAKIGNWDLDVRTNTLHWSDQIFEIFGIDKTKFGANYEAFRAGVHPDDRARPPRRHPYGCRPVRACTCTTTAR